MGQILNFRDAKNVLCKAFLKRRIKKEDPHNPYNELPEHFIPLSSDNAYIQSGKFGIPEEDKVFLFAVAIHTTDGKYILTELRFYGSATTYFQRTCCLPSLPNDGFLKWANVVIFDHIHIYNSLNKEFPLTILGKFPNSDFLEALLLMLKINQVPCVDKTDMIGDNKYQLIISQEKINNLQERLRDHPYILEIPGRFLAKNLHHLYVVK